MASVSSLNPLISKSLSVTQHFQFCSHQEPKVSIRMTPKKLTSVHGFSIESFKARWVLPIQAFQWSSEPEKESEPIIEAAATSVAETAVEEEPIKETSDNTASKEALIDALYGTERGLKASSETRAEIVEIISQLEANNPTPAPTEALPLLDGKWILVYTSYKALFPLLASGSIPLLLKVEEISQIIDSENFSVENIVVFAGQLATTSVSSNAKFEVRSPKRVQNQPNSYQSVFDSESLTLASIGLAAQYSDCIASTYQIKFEQGVIGTPQLIDWIVLPDSVPFFGRDIDLIPFKGLITSIQDTASSVIKNISIQPPFEFPITSDKAQAWLLTTYLDGELRISRGDCGSVFILIKEGSSLLTPKPKDEAPESVTIES